ncbi:acyl-CoA synthetase [Azospirillum rugosum]|uniref:Acetyl-CoA synthetase n=1 Tax=Azospirillum rugosum TaxID=416170 RepID=A0ABS4SJ61_9PROT|nr:acyl-CoA synthetase [Azospirillum rugosum]MBP2292607.1 acetyl-CoA synthetase [Azospirillum rugosum]MDQ0526369.1 acetyl-CoA synthetase [Azospirillum rugosum]
MLPKADSYDALRDRFVWAVPDRYNIGVDVCDKWAHRDPDRLALIHKRRDGGVENYSFADLRRLSNRLANALAAQGVVRGDRVGILLPQAPETAVTHIAAYKMGCIAVPLFSLFGVEALEYRLGNCGAKVVVTDAVGAAKIAQIRDRLPELQLVLRIDVAAGGAGDGEQDWHRLVDAAPEDFTPVDTAADAPAVIIYTSGTTGQPKGALHAHRVLLGHLPGVEISHDLFPQDGDRIWTPADWAWIGGLLDVLLPALHHGVTVVSHRFEKFDGEEAFRLIAEFGVRNAFLPPTALKMMRAVKDPQARWSYSMRSVASGGETLGAELLDWGRQTFGVTINEFYGQTECNMIVSSCAAVMPPKPGIMGRPVPGHDVAVIDESGKRLGPGQLGLIAVHRPDPVMFLQYWNNPQATAAKFIADWLVTGDQGELDADGYIRFVGRDDDVITSAGYRIGPGEIEDCLIGHPAVRMAAVVGVPDPLRTEIVKAFIVLQDGVRPSDELAAEIQAHVKTRLAAHEYPRAVEFVDSLPMTTTGKIIRRELRSRG